MTEFEKQILNLVNKNEKGSFPLVKENKDNKNLIDITFVYEGTEDIENILLVLPIGGNRMNKNLMKNIEGTNIWYKSYTARNDIKFLYYFSVNDSLNVREPRNLNELSVDKFNEKTLTFNGETTLSYYEMPSCKENPIKCLNQKPIGNLIKEEVYSKDLNKNITITTYLPPNFDKNNEYGLALFTDGDEHLELLSANIILDNLITENKIKPVIGLFIDSNYERTKELRCDKDFENFVIKQMLPLLKEKYKISKNPKDNLISGFSLGGLTAAYLGLRHSDIFKNVLSQSGSFFFEIPKIRKLIINSKRKPNFYLNAGVLENKAKVIDGNKKIYSILRKNKFNVTYQEFKSGHDYLSWDEYLYYGLLNLLSNY